MTEEMFIERDYWKMRNWGFSHEQTIESLRFDYWLWRQLCESDPNDWVRE